ncbi:hypothetical protein [Motilibacter deserti]|uniref:NERD domain-containing protein n=1 Tax=Motilibacter deserti TaxID=2714956 RepID=A0ABX0GS87_9ACTN|nr:hypothetical protein [Motilibacter deserti]NHC13729.1 hypothetical protein [Motilibacter deserti]
MATALRQVTSLGYVRLEDRRWPDAVPLGPGAVLVGPAGVFAVDVLRTGRPRPGGAERLLERHSVRRRRARAAGAAAAIAGLLHPALGRHVCAVVALVGADPLPVRSLPEDVRAGDVASLVAWLAAEPQRLKPHVADLVVDSLRRGLPPALPIATPSVRQVSGVVNPRPLAGLYDRIRRG